MSRRFSLSVVVVCCAVSGAAAQPAPEGPFHDDLTAPDVHLIRYDITGTTARDLRQAMNNAGPRNPTHGRTFDGLTRWHYTWHWNGLPNGGCDLAHARVTFTADVTLPHLASAVSPELAAHWNRYLAALRIHESGHVDFARAHEPQLRAALAASTCAKANADAGAVLDVIRQHDRDYDAQTGHGRTQGAVFP